jgi:hypothetical protein
MNLLLPLLLFVVIQAHAFDCPSTINSPEEAAAALRALEQSKFFTSSASQKRFPGNQPTQFVLLRNFIAVHSNGTVADTSANIINKMSGKPSRLKKKLTLRR